MTGNDSAVPGTAQIPQIRLLIADDEHLIRSALEALLALEPDISVVAGADNGATAAELALAHSPDVCLLDLEMPGLDGIAAADVKEDGTGFKMVYSIGIK